MKGQALGLHIPTPQVYSSFSLFKKCPCVWSGCVVVSIADSFAPTEVATRLKISNAKGVFTQDFIKRSGKKLPLYAKVVEAGAAMAIVLPVDSPTPEVRNIFVVAN